MMMTIVSVLPLSVVQMEQCLHPTLQHFTLTLATPDTDWQTPTTMGTDYDVIMYVSKVRIYVDNIFNCISEDFPMFHIAGFESQFSKFPIL